MSLTVDGLCPLLQVFDMPSSLAFYRDVLGFEVVAAVPAGDHCDWALLRLGPAELMLNTAYEAPERPPTPDPRRVAAHRDTALFFGCADVREAYEHLLEQGLDVRPPTVRDYGMTQLYVRDPDGYELCFQCPTAP